MNGGLAGILPYITLIKSGGVALKLHFSFNIWTFTWTYFCVTNIDLVGRITFFAAEA